MKRILYSPEAVSKINLIYRNVCAQYGKEKGREVKAEIINRIRSLSKMEKQGVSMYELYGVIPDYRKLYVAHNHIFYLIEDRTIQIINVYNEREDFMWKLFGIRYTD